MPKVATKFTADVTVKVGRQSMIIKIPLDLADLNSSALEGSVLDSAGPKIRELMKLQVANFRDLKNAYKAYKKAHP